MGAIGSNRGRSTGAGVLTPAALFPSPTSPTRATDDAALNDSATYTDAPLPIGAAGTAAMSSPSGTVLTPLNLIAESAANKRARSLADPVG